MSLSIKQTKKILGKLAEGVSDEQMLKEIKAAELLKVLYFRRILSNNNSNYGKA